MSMALSDSAGELKQVDTVKPPSNNVKIQVLCLWKTYK